MSKKINVEWEIEDGHRMIMMFEADSMTINDTGDLLILREGDLVAIYRSWTRCYIGQTEENGK